ncbi:MAG TPA: hypothetical protein VFX59_19075 [Polyangiales bacterium]|nr:hypothetical protein [Polyangiales bacterium]
MGKLGRVIAVGALLCACSNEAPSASQGQATKVIPRAKAALDVPDADPRFDAEGNLRASTLKVGWFEVPMGFERVAGSTEHNGIFEAVGVSQAQLRKYVTARGTPASTEYMRHGEIYKQLAPSHTQLPLPPVDVTALVADAASKRLRLLIDDKAPTEAALTPQQAMDKLAKARDRTE